MRIAVVLGLLFAMSDSAAQQTEIDAAVAAPAPVERVRRLEQLVGSVAEDEAAARQQRYS